MEVRNCSAWARVQDNGSLRENRCGFEGCIAHVVVLEDNIRGALWSVSRSVTEHREVEDLSAFRSALSTTEQPRNVCEASTVRLVVPLAS